ncbi:hypothetical protein GF324_03140 [bacterium]|nr:hypothetical protein [bacterium]
MQESVEPYTKFFYPLDTAQAWHRLYGRRGFVQYQFVVPDDGAYECIQKVLTYCIEQKTVSSLAVLKRMGPGHGFLSFPMKGWTLAMDIAVQDRLWAVLDELDRIVLDYGGRVYLVKDLRLKPDTFRQMYKQWPDWLAVKRQIDPDNRFSSDLSRRLRLCPLKT